MQIDQKRKSMPDDDTYVLDSYALIGYPISCADAFAAAAAKIYDAILLTGDPEFKALENKGIIKMKWLNPWDKNLKPALYKTRSEMTQNNPTNPMNSMNSTTPSPKGAKQN
jgi:hypothetical protein